MRIKEGKKEDKRGGKRREFPAPAEQDSIHPREPPGRDDSLAPAGNSSPSQRKFGLFHSWLRAQAGGFWVEMMEKTRRIPKVSQICGSRGLGLSRGAAPAGGRGRDGIQIAKIHLDWDTEKSKLPQNPLRKIQIAPKFTQKNPNCSKSTQKNPNCPKMWGKCGIKVG